MTHHGPGRAGGANHGMIDNRTKAHAGAGPEKRIGLLAGWGRYPIVVAEALARQGCQTYCLGVKGHADPALARVCADFDWLSLGRLGSAIRYFRRHGVQRVTMAGKIHKFQLLQPWMWLKHFPDWRTLRRFYHHFVSSKKDNRDDTLLHAVVLEFARDGLIFAPATDFAPELLVKQVGSCQAGHDQESTTDSEKAGKGAGAEAIAEHFWRVLASALRPFNPDLLAPAKHQHANDNHDDREQEQQPLAVERLSGGRSGKGPGNAGGGIDQPAAPLYCPVPGMVEEAKRGVGGDRQRAGSDRDMRALDAHQIDHQRNGEDRPAAADEAQAEADQRARQHP